MHKLEMDKEIPIELVPIPSWMNMTVWAHIELSVGGTMLSCGHDFCVHHCMYVKNVHCCLYLCPGVFIACGLCAQLLW